jgi:hypothetical protein
MHAVLKNDAFKFFDVLPNALQLLGWVRVGWVGVYFKIYSKAHATGHGIHN